MGKSGEHNCVDCNIVGVLRVDSHENGINYEIKKTSFRVDTLFKLNL